MDFRDGQEMNSRPALRHVVLVIVACLLAASGSRVEAQQVIPLSPPLAFFTNVAGRLLKSELNLELGALQIYPTNQYTPAVHRLLQITSNLYDSTTNRAFGGTSFPYCPTVFRPLFRRTYAGTNEIILVAGYREVVDTTMANSATAPPMLTVEEALAATNVIPLVGVPPSPTERLEPMITGVPLVIGARKGFPNFNEFSMQTYISVSRLLEFRRETISGPVTLTNQMYTLVLTNTLGVEAWNAYSNPYPRNLQLLGQVQLTSVLTNLTDDGQGYTLLTNQVSQGISTNISAGSWPGWTSLFQLPASFLLPLGNGTSSMITQSSYLDQPPSLEPLTHSFSQGGNFYVPRLWLNLNVRLLFILVDTDAQRIVDYVNLDHWEPTVDITGKLAENADCSGNFRSLSDPSVLWCTNRVQSSNDPAVPTIGVMNQIAVGLGLGQPSGGLVSDAYAGTDVAAAIDSFRYNLMGWGPIFAQDQGKVFYRSNVFYVPLDPYTPLYEHASWQANDPLVHYTVEDLTDTRLLTESNRVNFLSQSPPLDNLGTLNLRYEPWGGNPLHSSFTMPPFQLAAKDPLVGGANDWDFPTNQSLDPSWIGRVHRGTPWQTLFLKSTNVLLQTGRPAVDLSTWESWTGDTLVRPDWPGDGSFVPDALATAPTNDWQIVSRIAPLFITNDVRQLASANQSTAEAWSALLDGLTAVTNPATGEFDLITISSNSPAAMAVGRALVENQALQRNRFFAGVGHILTTPELSVASPWLNATNGVVDDRSYELLASGLLGRLRPDSFGSVEWLGSGGLVAFTFTGFDDYTYVVQTSQDLLNWTDLATFHPTNGIFSFTNSVSGDSRGFIRTSLLP